MKKFIILSVLVLSLFSTALYAQNNPTITIVNNTGYDCYFLYVSPVTDDSWGNSVLGSGNLPNGSSFRYTLPRPLSAADKYDFLMIDLDGDSYTKRNITVTSGATITFTFNDFNYTPTYDGPEITIVNNTGYTVWYVYVSPVSDDSWGIDRLDSNQVLANGQSVTIRLPFPLEIVDLYDIMLEDSDGDTYTKSDLLLSAGSRIVFTFNDFDQR